MMFGDEKPIHIMLEPPSTLKLFTPFLYASSPFHSTLKNASISLPTNHSSQPNPSIWSNSSLSLLLPWPPHSLVQQRSIINMGSGIAFTAFSSKVRTARAPVSGYQFLTCHTVRRSRSYPYLCRTSRRHRPFDHQQQLLFMH